MWYPLKPHFIKRAHMPKTSRQKPGENGVIKGRSIKISPSPYSQQINLAGTSQGVCALLAEASCAADQTFLRVLYKDGCCEVAASCGVVQFEPLPFVFIVLSSTAEMEMEMVVQELSGFCLFLGFVISSEA